MLKQLRPKLAEATFVGDVQRLATEGFLLTVLLDPDAVAVAGFRVMEMFSTGRILLLEDLVTDENKRSSGHGAALIRWLLDEAARRGCRYVELDTGLKSEAAHRFYRRHGFEEICLHFSAPVAGGPKWSNV